jgi:uncharacterized membrane protein
MSNVCLMYVMYVMYVCMYVMYIMYVMYVIFVMYVLYVAIVVLRKVCTRNASVKRSNAKERVCAYQRLV